MDAALRSLLADKDVVNSAVSSSNDLRMNKLQIIEEEVTTTADANYKRISKVCQNNLFQPSLPTVHSLSPFNSRCKSTRSIAIVIEWSRSTRGIDDSWIRSNRWSKISPIKSNLPSLMETTEGCVCLKTE